MPSTSVNPPRLVCLLWAVLQDRSGSTPEDVQWIGAPPPLEVVAGLSLFVLLAGLLSFGHLRRAAKRAVELEQRNQDLAASKKALETSDSEFRDLFENDIVSRFVLDSDGRVRRWNSAFSNFLNLGTEDIDGQLAADLLDGFPDLKEGRGTEDLPGQVEVRGRGDRSSLSTGLLALASPSDAGEVHGSLVDITERRALEEQLLWTQKMETVGRLAGGVAHDVNNMLGVILGNVELIQAEGPFLGTVDEDLAEIREATVRSSRLTRQLLTMARRDVAKPSSLDLSKVTRDMVPMLRRVVGSDIELVMLLEDHPSPVSMDLGQLEQVILNLVVNACEAMPEGGKLVLETATVPSDDAGPESVRLRVQDSGRGMEEETRAKIFEPFFSTKEAGSGLGLSTVYGVVTRHGGAVECTSAWGAGATFDLIFPSVSEAPEEALKPSRSQGPEALNLSVLLAEDEDGLRSLARRMLEKRECVVEEAENGEEALRIISSDPDRFDVLVTDLVMPILGGWDLVEGARALRPDLPVVFMSGYADHAGVRRRLQKDTDVFLQKPFKAAELAAAVESITR